MWKLYFCSCLLLLIPIFGNSYLAMSGEYFSSKIFSDEGEEWIDLSQRRETEDFPSSIPEFEELKLVMGDEDSDRVSQTQDYFSTLKFDSSGKLIESEGISLSNLLQDQSYFTTTWEREQAEQIFFESRELSMAGSKEEALNLLNRYRPTFDQQKAKLMYMKVQDLVVILRGSLSFSNRHEFTLQLQQAINELASYQDQLIISDRELVQDLMMHARVEIEQSRNELNRLERMSRNNFKPVQPEVSPNIDLASPNVSAITVPSVSSKPPHPIQVPNPSVQKHTAPTVPPNAKTKPKLSDRNPIMSLRINGPKDIGRNEAEIILRGIGLMTSKRGFQKSLQGLYKGHTYKSNPNAKLDSQMREFLFNEFRLMRKALDKYSDKPNISQKATPKLYDQWMQKASLELTALGSQRERFALLKSLMTQESGRTHWRDFVPVMGYTADIGFGQFLPATAKSVGINPYDPEENIRGIAIYLNRLIKKKGIRDGLASYNGGNKPPARSFRYADNIMSRLA